MWVEAAARLASPSSPEVRGKLADVFARVAKCLEKTVVHNMHCIYHFGETIYVLKSIEDLPGLGKFTFS